VESNRFHPRPTLFFLTRTAFQVTVDRKLYRRQVITEDGVTHLKKFFLPGLALAVLLSLYIFSFLCFIRTVRFVVFPWVYVAAPKIFK